MSGIERGGSGPAREGVTPSYAYQWNGAIEERGVCKCSSQRQSSMDCMHVAVCTKQSEMTLRRRTCDFGWMKTLALTSNKLIDLSDVPLPASDFSIRQDICEDAQTGAIDQEGVGDIASADSDLIWILACLHASVSTTSPVDEGVSCDSHHASLDGRRHCIIQLTVSFVQRKHSRTTTITELPCDEAIVALSTQTLSSAPKRSPQIASPSTAPQVTRTRSEIDTVA